MSFNMSRLLSYFAALISRIVSGLFNAFFISKMAFYEFVCISFVHNLCDNLL